MLNPDQQQELLDSVVEEFTIRLRAGERPAISEYTDKYPSAAEDIEELLTSVAMIEELKTQQPPSQTTLKREMKEILKLSHIGDYKIIKELGRGGMGIVFEAVHESLGRRVAIKVMPNRTFDDQKYLERFRREAQAAASLHHTNIVSVFGIGQTGEHHYYVMEFVDGEPLSRILSRLNELNESITQDGKNLETIVEGNPERDGGSEQSGFGVVPTVKPTQQLFNSSRQRVRWAAQLGSQIADGLAYAHALGMLHRDVKPSNLLVDKNETIWLTDFGLVKNISNQTITKTGDIIGTPQYMAPESFEGEYDERSETYCLGLSLYEMATLRPAFENASTPELIRRITTTTPTPPRKLDPKMPRDLERIILKAISKEPSYRYQSAASMRDDLRAFLDDRPISARKISMIENLWRWGRRNPFSAAMSVLTGLMICLIAVAATIALAINNRALAESIKNKQQLEGEFRRANHNLREAERATMFAVSSYDRMFRAKILDHRELDEDVSLDGFMNLEGISASIDESDAVFLERMLEFYEKFAVQSPDNSSDRPSLYDFTPSPELIELSASSFRRLANIYHLIGEFDKAIEAYNNSIDIYEEIQGRNPKSIPAALNLVKTIKEKARALELNSEPNQRRKVEAEYDRAIKILREHRSRDIPSDNRLQVELAKTLLLKSFPPMDLPHPLPPRFSDLRRDVPGMFGRDRSLVSLIRAYRNTNRNPNNNRHPGRGRLAVSQRILDEFKESSEQAIGECLAIADRLLTKQAYNREVLFVKAISLTRQAIILHASGETSDAVKALRESTKILLELKKQEPDNAEYEFALAQNYSLPHRRRILEVNSLEKAKEIMLSLVQRFERNVEYQQFLGNICVRLGTHYRMAGRSELAESNLELAYSTYRPLLPITPRNQAIQRAGLTGLLNYVDILMDNGKMEQAVDLLESSLEDVEQLRDRLEISRIERHYRKTKICLHNALALVYKEAGRFDEAVRAQEKAIYLHEKAPGLKRLREIKANGVRR